MITRIRVRGPHGDIDRSIDHGPGAATGLPRNGGLPVGHMITPDLSGTSWHNWDTPQPRSQPVVIPRRRDA